MFSERSFDMCTSILLHLAPVKILEISSHLTPYYITCDSVSSSATDSSFPLRHIMKLKVFPECEMATLLSFAKTTMSPNEKRVNEFIMIQYPRKL